MNVMNPYERPEISSAYELISGAYGESLAQDCVISTLRLDGQVLAASLGLNHRDEYHGLVMGMTTGEYKKLSPGRLLLIELNQYLSDSGTRFHDFGTGDTAYKLNWCNQENARYNVISAVSFRGWFLAQALKLYARGKAWAKTVKSNRGMKLFRGAYFWICKVQKLA